MYFNARWLDVSLGRKKGKRKMKTVSLINLYLAAIIIGIFLFLGLDIKNGKVGLWERMLFLQVYFLVILL